MSDNPATIEVAVALPVHNTFTYSVAEDLASLVSTGKRVLVPFARRRLTGFVLDASPPNPKLEVKPVLDILDDAPLFPESMIAFFRWIADYYIHPIGEVIKCALPGGLNVYDFATVSITAVGLRALEGKSATKLEKSALNLLINRPRRLKDLGQTLNPNVPATFIQSLQRRGWVSIKRELKNSRIRPKTQRYVAAVDADLPLDGLTKQRQKILDHLNSGGETSLENLNMRVPTTTPTVKSLESAGYVKFYNKRVYRDPFGETVDPDTPPNLTGDQKNVISRVIKTLGHGFATYLLAGVTGSGKTEVYMQLAAAVIDRGYSVLILIPEIALISQMERRFRARFGERVAVLHSGLSRGERYDQWQRIKRKEVPIAIGARSAIFAPFQDIGLIVVDEEHDTSYKQEGSLRYNARDLAIVRAQIEKCAAVLGSATPSIQSIYNAYKGKFTEVNLDKRVEKRPLPEITVVDLRQSRDQRGIRRFISADLMQAMKAALERSEQILLFLNRRGFANFPVCAECGESLKCKNCDISLTLHQAANAYKCHYCGFARAGSSTCSKCGSAQIRHLGLGTEKIEAALLKIFPEARVARMDRDTTRRKGSIVKILKDLRHHRIDILVGTQMVAKGHDFPNITLVGIICADLSLSFPDFRAGERTFQLLAQVSGRAGRGDAPGKVILQTYNPDHFSIVAARRQDFKTFYDEEIVFRRTLKYPPFSRLIQLKISGRDKGQTAEHAHAIGDLCRRLQDRNEVFRKSVGILGPIEAALTRIAGKYRWQILLKGSGARSLHQFTRSLMFENPARFHRRGVKVAVDVDPYSML